MLVAPAAVIAEVLVGAALKSIARKGLPAELARYMQASAAPAIPRASSDSDDGAGTCPTHCCQYGMECPPRCEHSRPLLNRTTRDVLA
jgi:hypothetical protein